MKRIVLLSLSMLCFITVMAQETFPVNGVQDKRPGLYAFINATIVVDADQTISNGVLLIRGDKIEAVGSNVTIPRGTVVVDLKGKYIYPSLIDAYSSYGMPEIRRPGFDFNRAPQYVSNKKGAFNWNEAIKPEYKSRDNFAVDTRKADEMRKMGFGAVLTHNADGIARGSSVFATLANGTENEVLLNDRASFHYSFNKGSSTQDYPQSLMGSMALIRQTFYDAQWYKANAGKVEANISLDELNKNLDIPQVFETSDWLDILRADKLGKELGLRYIFKGNGDEYKRIADIKNTGASVMIPLSFPKAFDVEDPNDVRQVGLDQMMHWEHAPGNAAALEKAGINFTIIPASDGRDFWANLRLAIDYGLSEKAALRALTQTPARLFKVADKVGALKPGMLANFLITSNNIFNKENQIYENWVQGKQYIVNEMNVNDIRGTYDLLISGMSPIKMKVTGNQNSPEINLEMDTLKAKATTSRRGDFFTIAFEFNKIQKGDIRLSGFISSKTPMTLKGDGALPDGTSFSWTANFKEAFVEPAKKADENKYVLNVGPVNYPFGSYGWTEAPKQERVLIRNATVWTNEAEGILQNTDVLIDKGKIIQIGKNLSTSGAKVVDGTGKHLTAGIIDEHSHIAISRGVNEGTQAVTSEVNIEDVLNSEDINIYRQLAGGVTTSQLLHGSANPIGGRSALIKLRWGKSPDAMLFEGADKFIKFALGENVKQSNWGDRQTTRFPQTRMGVEQVYVDAFTRAKEYERQWKEYRSNPKVAKLVPRRDLELDILVEILNNKRFITCHSYVQSEINMLMHFADSMGFKVNTFTHILEGYKVADKMKERGIAASSFSDWWAFKVEVEDAIPYNGAIMHKLGVVTAFNSDDAEMARRLNQEAAKAIKYGDISEEDALKFVTLNPAKMLHIDNRVGSIKVGKDADIVLWNDHPLSIYAKPLQTYVDGIAYFDEARDKELRDVIVKERARLIQKMLDAKNKGAKTQKPALEVAPKFHCDHMYHFGGGLDDFIYNYYYHLNHGEVNRH